MSNVPFISTPSIDHTHGTTRADGAPQPTVTTPPTATTSSNTTTPLRGKTALVTGVSRRRGIGFAVASHLASLGANVFFHHYSPHDGNQPWGADDLAAVRDGIQVAAADDVLIGDLSLDLADPDAAGRLLDAASALTGRLDILVCNQAMSGGDGSILDMTAERLDAHWQVNARATLLLTAEFARRFAAEETASEPSRLPTAAMQTGQRLQRSGPPDEHATGRVIWMTSGQHLGAMAGEVAYAGSKSVLAGLTATVAKELLDVGVVLNTINPGPVNTGYLDPETTDRSVEDTAAMLRNTPFGRFGEPDDVARLIGWLATDAGRWIVGRVLVSDGGFSL